MVSKIWLNYSSFVWNTKYCYIIPSLDFISLRVYPPPKYTKSSYETQICIWNSRLCKTIHHPHNVSERLGVIHISADAKFAHLKRGITGLKHAYHAFTIIFLVCQPTLRPPLTPWWYFGSDPSPLRSSADIWWPLMYI